MPTPLHRLLQKLLPIAAIFILTGPGDAKAPGDHYAGDHYAAVHLADNNHSISGKLYHDLNSNGAFDNNELGVGTTAYLKLVAGNTVIDVVNPDDQTGDYSFDALDDGNYTIIIDDNDDPADFTATAPTDWQFESPATGSLSVSVAGVSLIDQDLGLSFNLDSPCQCGYGDGIFTQVEITIDGDISDWILPLSDLDNNACDPADDTDRDAPVQSTGRNLVRNSITFDNNFLYMFTQRTGQPNNTQNFLYYADIDLDGRLQTGEPVVVARWQGANTTVNLELHSYQAVDPLGDPMLDSQGFGDGYTLPGTLVAQSVLVNGVGDNTGTRMEWAVAWSDLGLAPGAAISWHTSSTNANPGSSSLPSQIDDNIAGCGGQCSGSNQFANVSVSPQNIRYQGITYLSERLTNTGNGNDLFDLELASSGDFTPDFLGFYRDLGTVGVFEDGIDQLLTDTDGDGLIDTGIIPGGQTVDLLIALDIPDGITKGCVEVDVTATSNFAPGCGATIIPPSGSVTFDFCIQADLSLTKTVSPVVVSVGDNVVFALELTNNGPSEATGVTVEDQLPSGYNYLTDNSGGNYDSNSGIWSISSILAGETLSLNIVATVLGSGGYTNVAEVISSLPEDPNSTPGNGQLAEDDQDSATPTVNQKPFADNDMASTNEDVAVDIDILDGDSDPDGTLDPATITIISAPANGSLSIDNLTGIVTYTPDPDFNGNDSFQYTISDDLGATSNVATVSIDIISVNDAPIITDLNFSIDEDQNIVGTLLDNVSDPDGNNLSVNTTPVSGPSNGTLVINPDGTFDYTPDPDFNGSDSFVYEVCDDGVPPECVQATVTIDVNSINDPPLAGNDVITTDEDTPVNGDLSLNDSDPAEGHNLIYTTDPVATPANGTVVINADGTYTYTPDPDFNGSDSFTYEVCDDGTPSACSQATVNVTVDQVNDPPVANDDLASGDPGTSIIIDALNNDSDPDNHNLSITALIAGPSNGSASILADGTIEYISNPLFIGVDLITYQVCDDGNPSLCTTADISIFVPYTPLPPEPTDDQIEVDEDSSVSEDLLANDSDPNAGEQLVINTTPVSGPSNGTLVINPDGTFDYTPDPDFNGSDSFVYEVCDDVIPSQCATATVNITVNPVNDTPEGTDDSYTGAEDTPISGNVLDNDTDLDGDILRVNPIPVSGPSNGELILNSDGTFDYIPDPDFNGTDSFTYEVCDNGSPVACETATVTITVTEVNDNPVVTDIEVTTDEDEPASGNLLAGATDPDGDNLVVNTTPISGPSNGSVTIMPDGTYTYTPDVDFNGIDSFVVEICDDAIPPACSQITITVEVSPVNDDPSAQPDSYTTDEDVPLTINLPGVMTNDSDIDGDVIFVSAFDVLSANGGVITMRQNGSFDYLPPLGFFGQDTFSYSIADGNGGFSSATVTITINLVNSAPVVYSLNKTGLVNNEVSFTATDFQNAFQDQDGEALVMVMILSLPSNGILLLNGVPVTLNQEIPLSELDNLIFQPDPGFTGQASFDWTGSDGHEYAPSPASVGITIPFDSDNDGIPDAIELGNEVDPVDTDNDGIPDYLDLDSDGDGIPDSTEAGSDPQNPVDTDMDGIPDFMDEDSDGDGKPDQIEGLTDCDGDGIANYIDADDGCIDDLIFYRGLSPNGDGQNDVWEIDGIWKYPGNTVQIFNRWGNLVFKIQGYDNFNNVWRGQSNQGWTIGGEELPDGTYFYLVDLGDGSKVNSGYVMLKR